MNSDQEILGDVSRETLGMLHKFAELVAAYNHHTNLIARSTVSNMWLRHVLDSAQLHKLCPTKKTWLDLGSGGGFPGIVTAILLKGSLDAHVDLVESIGKKASFLRSVVEVLEVPATVWERRVETLRNVVAIPEILSGRAFAPLPRLLEWASPWLEAGSIGLFHKGRNFAVEVQESRAHWDFDMVKHRSLTDSDAAILEIRNLRRN